jgi:uncharacterized protein (DUF4415 family)
MVPSEQAYDPNNEEYPVTKPPVRRRPTDPFSVAEAVFKPAPPAIEPSPVAPKGAVPTTRETVSLRLDSDVLAYFQEDGPGWQDRINQALRKAAGLA